MPFSTTAIRYGWVALTSLGIITGATIYVINNHREQVKPQDVIEIVLGTYERCLATHFTTNLIPIGYYRVSPLDFGRAWYSNVYTTNGVTIYTNIVTNTIGWHIDRTYMVDLDTWIKALVPYYADPDFVYDGTTNIVMLTVTGLWASLGIGDRTNQFTREPCWTNLVRTNWIVNYTSYWPSTNGATTNISYTSDYRQVVNYAESWTMTGGYVWVTSSNWGSEAVTVTNIATYGGYPWQIYAEDLQERYKVLNALKICNLGHSLLEITSNDFRYAEGTNWAITASNFSAAEWNPTYMNWYPFAFLQYTPSPNYLMYRLRTLFTLQNIFSTNISLKNVWAFDRVTAWETNDPTSYFLEEMATPGQQNTLAAIIFLSNPVLTDFPASVMIGDSDEPIPDTYDAPILQFSYGWKLGGLFEDSAEVLVEYQFNYCTNKYW